jgi:hypothetical protein
MSPSDRYADRLADFAWQSWTELGVPGWLDQPTQWVIDPEALLLLTASLGPDYPRLWLNALDWSVDYVGEVAVDRVRNLHKSWPELRHWTDFSGVLTGHTNDKWPSPGPPDSIELPNTSRQVLDRPGALALRLRKGLGVSAHAEAIRVFLTYPEGTRLTVLEVAEEIAYTKRTAANVVGRMQAAGLVDRRRGTYAATFSLRKHRALADVFGPLPMRHSSYLFAVRGVWRLASTLDEAREGPQSVRSVEARRALGLAEEDLARAGLEPPTPAAGADAWDLASEWTDHVLDTVMSSHSLAVG